VSNGSRLRPNERGIGIAHASDRSGDAHTRRLDSAAGNVQPAWSTTRWPRSITAVAVMVGPVHLRPMLRTLKRTAERAGLDLTELIFTVQGHLRDHMSSERCRP
jgi:hypothetical protein